MQYCNIVPIFLVIEKKCVPLQQRKKCTKMETQLVRHDKPYNIICGKNGSFALHVATLLTITETDRKDAAGNEIDQFPLIHSYPVVGRTYKIDGEVWTSTEQKDCLVVCREGEPVSLYTLKKVMEFCAKNVINYWLKTPAFFNLAMLEYGCRVVLPTDNSKKTISDYEVHLVFEEAEDGKTCMVYADKDSDFYFYEYFANAEEIISFVKTNSEAVKYIAELRDNYLMVLHAEGLRSITFKTENEEYQWFVDELNSTKPDGE